MLLGKLNYKTFKILLVALLVCLPLGLSSSPVSAQSLQSLPSIKNCSLLSDKELAELRGSYDTYSFSMDIGISRVSNSPQVDVISASVPSSGPAPAFNGTAASFNNGNFSFQAGVGNGTLGQGVYQVVNVAGNNNIVSSNTNLSITH
jgi:hypothetical protein